MTYMHPRTQILLGLGILATGFGLVLLDNRRNSHEPVSSPPQCEELTPICEDILAEEQTP